MTDNNDNNIPTKEDTDKIFSKMNKDHIEKLKERSDKLSLEYIDKSDFSEVFDFKDLENGDGDSFLTFEQRHYLMELIQQLDYGIDSSVCILIISAPNSIILTKLANYMIHKINVCDSFDHKVTNIHYDTNSSDRLGITGSVMLTIKVPGVQ